ncbi:MAG: hypothetical protein LC795_15255 [Acidobacteria bacterium]|nr:hypothetical protein [Acidobacteriota bacterium]MCA1620634.1 hypothetical protein [Acidobacteriota bacterium]
MAETFDWLKPSLLWQPGATDMLRRGFFRPALHEFTTDKFMEDFLAAAASAAPKPLSDTLARAPAGRSTLKFFQPVHGNFYLTSASLCCHVPGFPDREVLAGEGESVFFVLRKKIEGVEYAWDAGETNRGWHSLGADPRVVPEGEERLPLFQAQTGQGRQLFFGYIPVSSQDTYAAAVTDLLPTGHQDDLRLHELDSRFIGPLAMTTSEDGSTPFESPGRVADPDVQLRISVYMLLDLWEYLDQYLPEVAAALRDGTTAQLAGAARDLTDYLESNLATFGGTSLTLGDALHKVSNDRDALNQPGDSDLVALGYTDDPSDPNDFTSDYNLNANKLTGLSDTLRLRGRVEAALLEVPETKPEAAPLPKFAPAGGNDLTEPGDQYVLRYVYERAQCDPPHRHLSRPTRAFELAPFFDPDAPGRNIRVGLPVDVSIAGLRKFKKNVGFIMSKELNAKLESLKGQEKATLDNEADPQGVSIDIGWICSFSLPIITLCAFILLMIIVIVLNLVFWWIPLLKICFPIPLIAKK